MSDTQTITMTQQGYDALVTELQELKEEKLPKAIARLALARSQGDLSENSEYHAAKEDLAMLQGRISELEYLIAQAKVVAPSKPNGKVSLGSKVIVQVGTKSGAHTFHIVGEFEADPMKQKISEKSPLGQALIGKKAGESIDVEAPAGKVVYKIKEVV